MKERRRFFTLAAICVLLLTILVSIVVVGDKTKTRLIQRKEDEVKAYYTALYFSGTGEGSAIALDNNTGYVTFNLMNFIGEDVTERDIIYEIATPTTFYTNKNVAIPDGQEDGSFMDQDDVIEGTTDDIHVRDVWGQPKKVGRETYKYGFEVVANNGEPTTEVITGESASAPNFLFSYEKLEGSSSAHAVGKTHNVTLKITREEGYDKLVGTESISVVVQLLKPYKEVYIINMTISERLIVFSNNVVTEFENTIEELSIQTADIYSHIYVKDEENSTQDNPVYKSIDRTFSTPKIGENGEQEKIGDELQYITKTATSKPLQVTLTWDNLIFNEVLTSYFPTGVVVTDLTTLSSDSGSVTLLIPQGSDFKLQFYATDATYQVSAKVEIYDSDVDGYVIYDKFFGGYTDTEITIKSDGASSNDSILVLNNTKEGLVH